MVRFYRQLFSGLPQEVWCLSLVTVVHRGGTMVLPFLALYLTTRHGFSAREAGGVLSLYGVGAIGGAYVGGWLSDRVGSINTQLAGLCLSAGGLVVLSAMQSPLSIIVIVLLWSLVAESIRPANAAALAELSPPALHVRAFGLRRLGMNLGMSISVAVLCRSERESAGGGVTVGAVSTSSSIRRSGEDRLHGDGVSERDASLSVARRRFSRFGRARYPLSDRALPVIRGLSVNTE